MESWRYDIDYSRYLTYYLRDNMYIYTYIYSRNLISDNIFFIVRLNVLKDAHLRDSGIIIYFQVRYYGKFR